ncbi:hypothetical protein GDO86_005144 [Hymenochirus boettgeri]|uniref:Uncharacterized protein n=1 Tax=Hymenochirus boettgeri TaxID=247094 RepID=A0A8T2J0P0_9PIPI|nr:hypothetical protein GDO86_005144 [Hymenochirus boettgeri]
MATIVKLNLICSPLISMKKMSLMSPLRNWHCILITLHCTIFLFGFFFAVIKFEAAYNSKLLSHIVLLKGKKRKKKGNFKKKVRTIIRSGKSRMFSYKIMLKVSF